jgi:glycosyltransferase involved in cell wall biosynthesis
MPTVDQANRNLTFHLWLPGVEETGGIQHYSLCVLNALRAEFPSARLTVINKNDVERTAADAEQVCFGRWPARLRTLAFAMYGIFRAWKDRPTAIIATHPHFAKAARFTASPLVVAAHGVEVWDSLGGAMGAALRGAAMVIPVSEFTRQVLLRDGGIAPAKCVVVPDTFREHSFQPGAKSPLLIERYDLDSSQAVLLSVGRLASSEAYKGQDQVIAALPKIREQIPNVRYLIVGRGDDEPRLRKLVAEHHQEDAVIFAGFVPEDELADHYRLCDAFVMPSTGEGFGIVYLEAIASGKPCIVGDRDASPEAINHGRWGFIVNPRSPPEIAAAATQLLLRQHEKPWLHEPTTLQREVIELYGFAAFQKSLRHALEQF